jgi:hypothetical protein
MVDVSVPMTYPEFVVVVVFRLATPGCCAVTVPPAALPDDIAVPSQNGAAE